MSGFAPGDRVECVAREFNNCPNVQRHRETQKRNGHVSRLVTGRIYTVDRITSFRGEHGVHLVEIPSDNPPGYCAGRFRKVRPADESFTRKVRACRPIKQPARIDAKATS